GEHEPGVRGLIDAEQRAARRHFRPTPRSAPPVSSQSAPAGRWYGQNKAASRSFLALTAVTDGQRYESFRFFTRKPPADPTGACRFRRRRAESDRSNEKEQRPPIYTVHSCVVRWLTSGPSQSLSMPTIHIALSLDRITIESTADQLYAKCAFILAPGGGGLMPLMSSSRR
uniref:Uncharacterized protein n=1 Tax=Plectus sambesii TaxID=2011161 RepID=A0A914XGG4_9BILA